MQFDIKVTEKVAIVNNALDEINASRLFENADFSIDEMSTESWLKINLNSCNDSRIQLSLTLALDTLEISLENITEVIDWTNEQLRDYRYQVVNTLKNILTRNILVEHYGHSKTIIKILDPQGLCINKFTHMERFSWSRQKKKERLYPPIYIPV